jgi:hypothetical protein
VFEFDQAVTHKVDLSRYDICIEWNSVGLQLEAFKRRVHKVDELSGSGEKVCLFVALLADGLDYIV